MKKNVYVIGGSGLIGDSLVAQLSLNYNVLILDKLKKKKIKKKFY